MERLPQPPTNDELLTQAERNLKWAQNNYGSPYNNLADTAARISLAASALVIARLLGEQVELMHEIDLPEVAPQTEEGA